MKHHRHRYIIELTLFALTLNNYPNHSKHLMKKRSTTVPYSATAGRNALKKLFVCIAMAFPLIHTAYSQVGINTDTPDSTAALDIQSPPGGNDNRGVLFPRMTSAQRDSMDNPAMSLFVFDVTDKLYYYYDGSEWVGLVPKDPIGGHTGTSPQVNGDITVTNGTISAPNISGTTMTATNMNPTNLNITGFATNALVPSRVIVMWSGSIASIPPGWTLCNGNNGTPNLSSRFIVGYDALSGDYNTPGNTGGASTTVLNKNQLPLHQHSITDGTDGATMSSPGNHSHQIGYDDQDRSGGNTGTSLVRNFPGPDGNSSTSGAGDHRHSGVTGTGASDGLSASPIENRPPYYVLAFIMKL